MALRHLVVASLVLACAVPAEARRGRRGGSASFLAPVAFSSFAAYGYDEFGDPIPAPLPPGYRPMSPEEAARVADAGHAQRLATAGSPSIPTFPAPRPAPVPAYVPTPTPPPPPAEPRTIEMNAGEPEVTVIRRGNGITEIVPR